MNYKPKDFTSIRERDNQHNTTHNADHNNRGTIPMTTIYRIITLLLVTAALLISVRYYPLMSAGDVTVLILGTLACLHPPSPNVALCLGAITILLLAQYGLMIGLMHSWWLLVPIYLCRIHIFGTTQEQDRAIETEAALTLASWTMRNSKDTNVGDLITAAITAKHIRNKFNK